MIDNPVLNTLLTRRSVLAANMTEPGPNKEQLQIILEAGHRVPDHGKIGPWRFIVFQNEAREAFGEILRNRFQEIDTEATDKLLNFETQRFMRAPLIIAVISSPVEHKVPEWEQVLAAGAVCQNILLAASALGYCSQWLTEWYAFDEKIAAELGLGEKEKVAGYIYIGTAKEPPKERARPSLADRMSYWK